MIQDAASAPAAVYRPLSIPRKEIRILKVHSELIEGIVSVSLEYVSLLESIPDFCAISWCWGDPSKRGAILIDGKLSDVPVNAVEVLKQLVVPHGYTTVWLDAVSINQSDIEERGHQVSIMRDVYSHAEKVLVWLGRDEGFADAALQSIRQLELQCREHTNDLVDFESRLLVGTGGRTARWFSYEPLPTDVDWQAIRHIYSVPLLCRVWIIQEVSLAKEAICFYGSRSLSWNSLGIAAEWMIHRNYERSEYTGAFIRGIMDCAIICSVRRGRHDMDRLFINSVQFDTTEPRDKIFGLLGLLSPEHGSSIITPSYSVPVVDIFTVATREAIRLTQRLWILGSVRIGTDIDASTYGAKLPSWVPDYAWPWERGAKAIRNFSRNGCDGHIPMKFDDNTDPATLRVHGVVAASLTGVFGPLSSTMLHDTAALADLFQQVLMAERAAAVCPLVDNLFRALIVDYYEDDESKVPKKVMRTQFDALCQVCRPYWRPECASLLCLTEELGIAAARAFRDHLKVTALHRYIFVTADGSVGQAASRPEVGDVVCILFGNDVPFILRPVQSGYRLISGAYLPGIMDGELIQKLQNEDALEGRKVWLDII